MHNTLLPVDSSEERATAQSDAVRDVPHAAEEVRVYLLHVFGDRDIAEKTAVRQTTGGNVAHERLGRVGIDVEPMSRHGDPAQEVMLDTSRPVVVTGEAETTEDPSHRCASCGESRRRRVMPSDTGTTDHLTARARVPSRS